MTEIKSVVTQKKPPMPTASGSRLPPQDFESLRRECLTKGVLFEDPYFPAADSTLFYSQRPPRKFEWKRPKDICPDAKLFVGGGSRFDVKQGILGDCWLLAAIASLADDNTILRKVIPYEQDFDSRYAGIFHFKFWHFGSWVDICVDDRLPTLNGKLVFLQSAESNEFWSALLEKAYAKLYGSYEALKGGHTSEAMEDFTGGVAESYDLHKAEASLFKTMQAAVAKKALMSCSIKPDPKQPEALDEKSGLIKGHAYSITGVNQVTPSGSSVSVDLVRVRNPWGHQEWKGDWSDQSSKWNQVSASVKSELTLALADDGEFWMSFDDFKNNFEELEICNITLDSFSEDDNVKSWASSFYEGSWVQGVSAGGCRNYKDTFANNPQYLLELQEDADGDGKCSILVGLMQKNRRSQRKLGAQDLCIGFSIYKVEGDADKVDSQFILYHRSTATSGSFTNSREVFKRFDLDPGRYVIVCCSFKPNDEGDFLLRVFTEKLAIPRTEEMAGKSDKEIKEDGIRSLFNRLAGSDGEIDCYELQDLMTYTLKKDVDSPAFGMEACRAMICMLDTDDSGTLNFEEFKNLLDHISKWKVTFRQVDANRSGTIERSEIFDALQKLNFDIPRDAQSALFYRFAKERSYMDFDDFVACCCRAEIMHNAFKKFGDGDSVTFSKTDFFKAVFNA